MLEALAEIKVYLDLPAESFTDVENLMKWMSSFEYVLLSSFWYKVLQCIDDVNKILQCANISIAEEANHLSDLCNEIQTVMDSWDKIYEEAKEVAASLGQTTEFQIKRQRNPGSIRDGESLFKVEVFYAPLDKLLVQLN